MGDVNSTIEQVRVAMLTMQRASWEQGVAAQAFLELGDSDMVYLLANESVLRQTEEGRLGVVYRDNGVTDPAASGEAVLSAAESHNDSALKEAADRMADYLLRRAPRSDSGTIYHTLNAPQIWIDSMYMCPPFLAAAGYYQEAIKQIKGIRRVLWNPSKRLFSHMWDDGKQAFAREAFWGVGNGWAAAGMSRVTRALPYDMRAEKDELAAYCRQVIDGCLAHIRPDGLFHNIVDEADSFVETNLSQMLAYSIFRGVEGQWLDRSYLDHAHIMRRAAHNQVNAHGYVQGVCGAPFFNSPGRATEGQAFFLLTEASYRDCQKS